MEHDTHPTWCATKPRCTLGHASAEHVITPDPDSPATISLRLWQLTARQERPTLVELEMTTFRGTRHATALSLPQAGSIAGHLSALADLVDGRPQHAGRAPGS